jgi:hypothetical protein
MPNDCDDNEDARFVLDQYAQQTMHKIQISQSLGLT